MAQRSIKIFIHFAFHRKLIHLKLVFPFVFFRYTSLLYLVVSLARLSVIMALHVKRFDMVTKKLTQNTYKHYKVY